jgi:hypothetical protein
MLRRTFLSTSALSTLGYGLPAAHAQPHTIAALSFFNILANGAVPDGKTLNTKAIQQAIKDAAGKGGGTVYVPPGVFMTGGLVLRSRVTLYLESGAVLLGSPNVADYEYHPGPPTNGDANGRHLIFARGCEDVVIAGLGVIDGNGSAFWARRDRVQPTPDELWRDVIATDWEPATTQRPSPMLEFAYCKNLRIEGVTLQNPAGWTLRPVACESVFITGIRVRNPVYSPNTDGMDITSCKNVFVSDCDIAAGDDAICIKSENPYGEPLPTQNIVVTNCTLTTSSNGFKIGTATDGAVENITFTNSVIYNRDVPYNYRVIAGIAIEMVDGGTLDGVSVSNISMKNVRTPIFVRLGHRNGGAGTFLRNVMIRGVDASGAILTSSITGMPDAPVQAVTLEDIRIRSGEAGEASWVTRFIPEVAKAYPEARMFGRLPGYGIYVRHAEQIRMRNVELIAEKPDYRPAVFCDDVQDVVISGLETRNAAPQNPVIELHDARRVFVQGSRAPVGCDLYVRVGGAGSAGISLAGNDLSDVKRVSACVDGAGRDVVSIHG